MQRIRLCTVCLTKNHNMKDQSHWLWLGYFQTVSFIWFVKSLYLFKLHRFFFYSSMKLVKRFNSLQNKKVLFSATTLQSSFLDTINDFWIWWDLILRMNCSCFPLQTKSSGSTEKSSDETSTEEKRKENAAKRLEVCMIYILSFCFLLFYVKFSN